ncbi:hypothetical protein MRX96_003259 [Rhipicephalus microplus]
MTRKDSTTARASRCGSEGNHSGCRSCFTWLWLGGATAGGDHRGLAGERCSLAPLEPFPAASSPPWRPLYSMTNSSGADVSRVLPPLLCIPGARQPSVMIV